MVDRHPGQGRLLYIFNISFAFCKICAILLSKYTSAAVKNTAIPHICGQLPHVNQGGTYMEQRNFMLLTDLYELTI